MPVLLEYDDWREASLHQYQVHEQSGCASVAVGEGVYVHHLVVG